MPRVCYETGVPDWTSAYLKDQEIPTLPWGPPATISFGCPLLGGLLVGKNIQTQKENYENRINDRMG